MHVESRSCASFHFGVPFSSSKSPRIKETMLIAFIQFILWSLLRNRLRDLSTRTTKEVLGRNRHGSHSTQGENQGLAAAPMLRYGTCGILWLAAPCWYPCVPMSRGSSRTSTICHWFGPLDLSLFRLHSFTLKTARERHDPQKTATNQERKIPREDTQRMQWCRALALKVLMHGLRFEPRAPSLLPLSSAYRARALQIG